MCQSKWKEPTSPMDWIPNPQRWHQQHQPIARWRPCPQRNMILDQLKQFDLAPASSWACDKRTYQTVIPARKYMIDFYFIKSEIIFNKELIKSSGDKIQNTCRMMDIRPCFLDEWYILSCWHCNSKHNDCWLCSYIVLRGGSVRGRPPLCSVPPWRRTRPSRATPPPSGRAGWWAARPPHSQRAAAVRYRLLSSSLPELHTEWPQTQNATERVRNRTSTFCSDDKIS